MKFFPDYSQRIIISGTSLTLTEDVYIEYIYTTSVRELPFYINNIKVSIYDSINNAYHINFNGFAKKGDIISCEILNNSNVCKVFKLK